MAFFLVTVFSLIFQLSVNARVLHDVKCDEMMIGVVMWGSDIYSSVTADFDGCVDLCKAVDDCLSISYLTTEHKCFLKNTFDGGKGISLAGGYVSMDLDCPWSVSQDQAAINSEFPGLNDCRKDDANFHGANVRSFVGSSFEKCVKTCQASEECIALTWGGDLSKMCWLKNRKDGESGAAAIDGFTSVNMDCLVDGLENSCSLKDVDMPGEDLIAHVTETFEECRDECEIRAKCRSFTFTVFDHKCFMKSKNNGESGQVDTLGSVSMNMDCIVLPAEEEEEEEEKEEELEVLEKRD